MACRYTYQGKTYEAHEFDDVLRAMSPSIAAEYMPGVRAVPSAPFVGTTDAWVNLALKRVIKMAVDEGYDRVAFVNGQQSADRYNLSKQAAGGHGMIAFYDELLPPIARSVVRKLGGAGMRRVRLPNMQASAGQGDGAGSLGRGGDSRELARMPCAAQLGFDINEAMRVSAAHGMPLFSLAQVTAGLPSWPEADGSEDQVQSEDARAEAG